ncbi:AAA family ATPase [Gordonibacter sp. RACS_AR49]|uniref:AAA family ATPase n=1 Tax=Gordonibacter sp. RACS_AR49 TaxID=2871986 RepID=UPI0026251654|nr:AAA family ATPase [Gordonibacter sp. RACS_AR49]MDN4509454.1 AAA family ATPase [Gordonibacter sp. RACS_AR49]
MRFENLAKHYIPALQSYGITIPQDGEGRFMLFEEDGTIVPEVRKQIIPLGEEGLIPQKLMQDAVLQYLDYQQQEDDILATYALAELHERQLDAHLALWQTMVDAAKAGRAFTDVELACYEKDISRARKDLKAARSNARADIAERAQALHDRETIRRYGLLFDREMIQDIDTLVGNALSARPTLLVGDKGIAKTQLAKFVMRLYGTEPLIVSVKGDMMSDELVGKMVHDAPRNTFVFEEGALPRAMRAGVPLLLDEINFGDQAIIARLQDILLKGPGESVFLQEEGIDLVVQPGFTVFATANEASARYRHREVLDPAIRDRFEVIERTYPDLDRDPLRRPSPSLMRLALCEAVDADGVFSRHLDRDLLNALVHLATLTEHLYAVPAKDAAISLEKDQAGSIVREDTAPLLTDCITPRALNRAVQDSAGGNLPGRHLDLYLIDKLLRTLDQAGSNHNASLARQAALLVGIDLSPVG